MLHESLLIRVSRGLRQGTLVTFARANGLPAAPHSLTIQHLRQSRNSNTTTTPHIVLLEHQRQQQKLPSSLATRCSSQVSRKQLGSVRRAASRIAAYSTSLRSLLDCSTANLRQHEHITVQTSFGAERGHTDRWPSTRSATQASAGEHLHAKEEASKETTDFTSTYSNTSSSKRRAAATTSAANDKWRQYNNSAHCSARRQQLLRVPNLCLQRYAHARTSLPRDETTE